jgi:superfamily I DNA and RNA helicase
MDFIAGSIGISGSAEEQRVATFLDNHLKHLDGLIGYKYPSVSVADKANIPSFVVLCEGYGVILIDIVDKNIVRCDKSYEWWITNEDENIKSRDTILDNFTKEIENRLKENRELYDRKAKKTRVNIRSIVYFVNTTQEVANSLDLISEAIYSQEGLLEYVINFCKPEKKTIDKILFDSIYALLEGTSVFEKKREIPTSQIPVTMNDYITKSLQNTFKLDTEQRKVAMQLPSGIQRIRGLAGTGKTVILALKAALAHKEFPEYKILYLFNTQSMYNHVKGLIEKYYVQETKQPMEWDNLQVLHAWGGEKSGEGLYSYICKLYGVMPYNYNQVRQYSDPYEYIFKDLLSKIKQQTKGTIEPIYDMVLIDEAQDFSQPLFELVYLLTKPPHRLIWAYDEFQTLKELKIREPEDLFGINAQGQPNVSNTALQGEYLGGIEKDFILSNSYRNPRLNLMLAHGLGLGLNRKAGIIDVLEDKKSWEALGYEVIAPQNKEKYVENDCMIIERPATHSKNMLEQLRTETGQDDKKIVHFEKFDTQEQQYKKLCKYVNYVINKQNIAPEQIIIISLARKNTEAIFNFISQELNNNYNIKSLTPGYNYVSSDKFQEKGFVTLTTPYRAKGNEANVVFVIDVENVMSNSTFQSRNALFVAITRARGWCHLYGSGQTMLNFEEEYNSLLASYPRFEFVMPNLQDLNRRRTILKEGDLKVNKDKEQKVEAVLDDDFSLNLLAEKLLSDPEKRDQILKQLGIKK